MSELKDLIDTVIIVMMENRSFDNILGHLSLSWHDDRQEVDGLKAKIKKDLERKEYLNMYSTEPYYPHEMEDDLMLSSDLPHNRCDIEIVQLAKKWGKYRMNGFVKSYIEEKKKDKGNLPLYPDPMGYYTPEQVPITNFLANNYAVCDRWFSPIPTSTVPNRLMSLTGKTRYDETKPKIHRVGHTLLDWLDTRNIKWNVYHDGFFSFFALLGEFDLIFGRNFGSIEDFETAMDKKKSHNYNPHVILIEPAYYDAPILRGNPNDNHAPLPVGPGEEFIKLIYDKLVSNYPRFEKTVMILTYDEHGGFYDHVAPLSIPHNPKQKNYDNPFECTGPRVPSIIVSPLVSPGRVYSGNLDHTSILQFIAELFDPRGVYSPAVTKRKEGEISIQSVSEVLDLRKARKQDDIPVSPDYSFDKTIPLMPVEPDKEKGLMEKAFIKAGKEAVKNHRYKVRRKYPDLITWNDSNE